MSLTHRLAITALAALLAACGAGGGAGAPSPSTPSAQPTPQPTPTPMPVPSADPDAQGYWLRLMTTQALAPIYVFAMAPQVVITGDGQWIIAGPVPAIYPGPLLPNLRSRQLTDAGRVAILQAAADLGLLSGKTDFNDGPAMAGGAIGRIELTVDGRQVVITGDPNAQGDPTPGSAAAFAVFWARMADLAAWIPAELGPDTEYLPSAYAILVGPAPTPDANLPQAPADWPLAQEISLFGGPVAGGQARCGTVDGADAEALRAAMAAANQLTPWVQDPQMSATFGLTVRPMIPGEDVCREVFGPG